MAYKRTRKEFEADLQAIQSPYVIYGTPLPPLDSEVRDDGSYVPVWKQEVRDEKGRKRLHGAFTGGFSAGYFNTVGSKEGWTPSTFVSSRANRHKDGAQTDQERREQYMDEEDLADAADAQKLQTQDSFAGLGSTGDDAKRKAGLIDLFRIGGDTMGAKLLRKMGWKDGHGIGPRVKREARLGAGHTGDAASDRHLFAPEDTPTVSFEKKYDRKGLGFTGESKLESNATKNPESDEDEDARSPFSKPKSSKTKQPVRPSRGAFGVGVLNDDDDQDDDPYQMGPTIAYNRTIGGDKKNKKKSNTKSSLTAANPSLGVKPVFRSAKLLQLRASTRRCHDGRLALEGFILSDPIDSSTGTLDMQKRYPIPDMPKDWKPARSKASTSSSSNPYISPADAARASTLDAKARSAILGETQLPGKSIFDYLTPEGRERIVAATGRTDLPPALSERLPPNPIIHFTSLDPHAPLTSDDIPPLAKQLAVSALGRGLAGWFPYADDEPKRSRYRAFLEFHAGKRTQLDPRPPSQDRAAQLKELREFAQAAEVFKPMTGAIASRFTTASALPGTTIQAADDSNHQLLRQPTKKIELADPAEQAARMGMFGPMTRSVGRFAPTKLLCKRFGVRPPENAVDEQRAGEASTEFAPGVGQSSKRAVRTEELVSQGAVEKMAENGKVDRGDSGKVGERKMIEDGRSKVDAERNEALEGQKAGEELFKSIFGDDDDDDED